MSNTIKLREVTKSFFCRGHVIPVIRSINIDVNPGEIVVIKGAKEKDKDTLLNILSLLDKPTSGEFIWNEENIADFSDKELKHKRENTVGMVLKAINIIDKMTIEENVMLPTFLNYDLASEDRKKNTIKALEIVGLLDMKDRLVSSLNNLEKIKVFLARGLVKDPDTIIMDDILESVSIQEQSIIEELIRDIVSLNKNIILVTNSENGFGDKIYTYKNGIIDMNDK